MSQKNDISRRDALKLMGLTIAGAAIATSGLLSFTSCTERKKRTILYFTGTGNCLHIARELGGKDAELLSIPQLMKNGIFDIEAEEIGIVYPIYGHMPPNMVRKFIQQANLKADYKFAVLTYGNRKCNAVEIWDDITSKLNCKFDYISTIIMVDNWLPNFDMNEQMQIDKHIPENLAKIADDINSRTQWHEPVTDLEREQHQGFLERSGIDPEVGFLVKSEDAFEIAKSCIGCGICTYVCPRGNYEYTSGGITTTGDCEFCFACIQNCPQKAIKFCKDSSITFLANGEKNPNARYRNENVSIMDIKLANSQKS